MGGYKGHGGSYRNKPKYTPKRKGKRTYRKKSRKTKGGYGHRGQRLVIKEPIMPSRLMVTLPAHYRVSNQAAANGDFQHNINNIPTPSFIVSGMDVDLVLGEPRGYDQWRILYNTYRVLFCRIKLRILNRYKTPIHVRAGFFAGSSSVVDENTAENFYSDVRSSRKVFTVDAAGEGTNYHETDITRYIKTASLIKDRYKRGEVHITTVGATDAEEIVRFELQWVSADGMNLIADDLIIHAQVYYGIEFSSKLAPALS